MQHSNIEKHIENLAEVVILAFKDFVQTVSGGELDAKLVKVERKKKEELQSLVELWPIGFELAFESGLIGKMTFLFKERDGLLLADLAAGTQSTEGQKLDEDKRKALKGIIDLVVSGMNVKLEQSRGAEVVASQVMFIGLKELQNIPVTYFARSDAPTLATLRLLIHSSLDVQVLVLFSTTLVRSAAGESVVDQQESLKRSDVGQPDAAVNLELPAGTSPFVTAQVSGSAREPLSASEENLKDFEKNIQRILDIELPVSLNFGQATLLLKEVLQFSAGSIIQLDKTADDPVSLMVNNKVIAKGQVIVVDGNYGIRITEIESTTDRIRSLG